ncbi:MAG: glutathione S-transferase family protein [Pseudomonadota bacterium]
MSAVYKLVGAEMSPYSVKVRSYFRGKAIAHQWIVASAAVREEYRSYCRIPVIPVVVTPQDEGIQDSTPIIERLEADQGGPSIHPDDTVTYFLSCLLEEFGDEWANKWMFHFRWAREVDQQSAATRLARTRDPEAADAALAPMVDKIIERMTGRVWFVGSNAQNAPQIEAGFDAALALLDRHLTARAYLFGARPSFGDFGLAPQLYSASTDPTAGARIAARYPNVLAWLQRMLWPRVEGDFEDWTTLQATLLPFLTAQVGTRFMPWTVANLAAVRDGREEFSVDLDGQRWTQKPQKYHAKSLAALRQKYDGITDKSALDPVLEQAGCLQGLRATA